MRYTRLRGFFRDDEAVTASEYAVMLVMIVGAIIAAVNAVGGTTADLWGRNISTITTAVNNAGS